MMRGWLRGLAFASILVAIWAAASSLARSPLAPTPLQVAKAIGGGVQDGTLVRAVLTSVLRLAVGYGLALALGVLLGVALARSKATKQLVGPVVLGLGSVPSIC